MDIKDHLNLIKNHGYKGKIGIVKHPINHINWNNDVGCEFYPGDGICIEIEAFARL